MRATAIGLLMLSLVCALPAAKPQAAAPEQPKPQAAAPEPMNFAGDVMPLLSKLGCNTAACHGSTRGRGGFKLSLFASEPDVDYVALTKHPPGRRVNRVEPAKSLFLLKPTAAIQHGGGERMKPGSHEYDVLMTWVAQGAVVGEAKGPQITALEIAPKEHTLKPGESQKLTATAVLSDGSRRDVTRDARFVSSDPAVVAVDAEGRATAKGFGQAAVSAGYLRVFAASRWLVPRQLPKPFPKIEPNNKIDELVFAHL